ncbi:hypothetical protein EDB89DRAFT_1370041 [Lactarius sanguifluus]|nr:hypothetical protein EDB89DRAFT_1370041 [Lactarius sanguifluus]
MRTRVDVTTTVSTYQGSYHSSPEYTRFKFLILSLFDLGVLDKTSGFQRLCLAHPIAPRFGPATANFAGVDVLIAAASGVSSSYGALVDLFECLGNFLKRLRTYTALPLSPSMLEISIKMMVELLSVLALATKQIKQGIFTARRKRD